MDNLSIKYKKITLKGGTLDSDGLIIKDTGINKSQTIIGFTFHQSLTEFKEKRLHIDGFSFDYPDEDNNNWVMRFRPTIITAIGTWEICLYYINTQFYTRN